MMANFLLHRLRAITTGQEPQDFLNLPQVVSLVTSALIHILWSLQTTMDAAIKTVLFLMNLLRFGQQAAKVHVTQH